MAPIDDPVGDEELRAELLERAAEDQRVRHLAVDHTGPDGTIPDDLAEQWRQVDAANTARLAEIVDTHGWPTRSLVGDDGAQAAWLLAQHADRRPDLQRRFLELMRAATDSGEASPKLLAYLVDRCATHEGSPQVYGTQLHYESGRLVPMEIADPDHVDQRRAAVGLGPLADYVAHSQP